MEFNQIMQILAAGDTISESAGYFGKGSSLFAATGFLTTGNLLFLVGSAVSVGTVLMQFWWDWYRLKRQAYLRTELYKAQLRKEAEKFGLDSKTIKALQESPDPDSEVEP